MQRDEHDRNYILCRFVGDQNGFLAHSVFDSLLYLRISLFDSAHGATTARERVY